MQYKALLKKFLLPIIFLLFCSNLHSGPYKILVLNSCHKTLSRTESSINGIGEGFKKHLTRPYLLHIDLTEKDKKNRHELPIVTGQTKHKFDYKQLKQFNLSLTGCPQKASIINNPFNKLKEIFSINIFTVSLIILLGAFIFILLRYNRIKKLKIIELKNYLAELEKTNTYLENEKLKAEKSNNIKSNLLTHISREIKIQLNAIINYSRIIDNHNTNGTNDKEQNQYFNFLRLNSQTLLNLINTIMDVSRIETNHFKLSYSNFDLNQMLSELHEYAFQKVKESNKKDLKIQSEKEIKSKKFFIRSDKERLKQVFINLLNNAIKRSHSGTLNFGYQLDGDNILFFVSDPGVSLNTKETEPIPDNLLQTEENKGAGLEFSLSKEIIENTKGKIWVDSQEYKNTVVYFMLPLISSSEKDSTSSQPNKNYNWEGKTILIVEDSRMAYDLIKKLLKGTNATFDLEKDGQSALERCIKDESIDLVLMDIQLPIIDGYTATMKIKEKRAQLPIIAQTANAMSDDRKKAFESGCDEYIAKPLDKKELAEKINKLINNK